VARIRREPAESGERRLETRDHRVERRHKIREVGRLFAEREAAMQATSIGDGGHFGRNLVQLPLRSP
jgi:hypothetical protein